MEKYSSPIDPEIRAFADFLRLSDIGDLDASMVDRRARAKARRQNWARAIPRMASHDPLFDENIAMAGRLGSAGCEVLMKIYPGTVHGFLEAESIVGSKLARLALEELGAFISRQADVARQ
jgi:hypothetical protein